MAAIDKAAIAWTIAIVAFGAGIAGMGDNLQSVTPEITTPAAPAAMQPEPKLEPETKQAEPFADIAAKVQEKALKPGWERATSMQDPGIGHETHQLAVLLPPSDKIYKGTLQYDASEPIQLVTLRGPLAPNEFTAKPIWTPDGETKFELTLVDQNSAKGTWDFSGNALAVHTFNENQFTVDYKLDYTETAPAKKMMEEQKKEAPAAKAGPKTVVVTVPAGTSVPGCEETNECYLPPSVSVNVGDTVSWDNVDTAAHTVTSGTPADGPDGKFDSSLLMGGKTFEVTFDTAGSYDYFCMVHPWMIGDVQVS